MMYKAAWSSLLSHIPFNTFLLIFNWHWPYFNNRRDCVIRLIFSDRLKK